MIVRELLALLGYKIDDSDLKKFDKSLDNVKGSLGGLKGLAAGAAAALAGLVTGGFISQIFEANAQYEKLNAQLEQSEGSAEKAKASFATIQGIAAKTPFQLNEVTDAWIKLRNRGIEPSEETLISFGDTASALGKDLDQFIEAVLDAQTGEFERLKEFGIKAKKDGQNVAFTFKGQTKVVKNNAKEITAFLESLGKEGGAFAGGMAKQMKTLNGIVSNMRDNFNKFLVAIGDAGFRDALKELFGVISQNVAGGADMAKTIGGVLAGAVRLLTRGLQFLIANWKEVTAALTGFGVVLGAIKLAGFIAGLGSLKAILAGILVAMLPVIKAFFLVVLPILIWAAAITTVLLLLEDLFVFFRGGPSAIGDFIKGFEKQEGILGSIARFLRDMLIGARALFKTLVRLGGELVSAVQPEIANMALFFSNVWEDIKRGFLEAMTAITGEAEGGGAFITRIFFAIRTIVLNVFPFVVNFIKGSLNTLLTAWIIWWRFVKGVFGFIRNLASAVFNTLKTDGAGTFDELIRALGELWNTFSIIFGLLRQAWTAVMAELGSTGTISIGDVAQALLILSVIIIKGVVGGLKVAIFVVQTLVNGFVLLHDAASAVANAMITQWTTIGNLILTALEGLGKIAGFDLGGIRETIGGVVSRVTGGGDTGVAAGQAATNTGGGPVNQTATATVGQVQVNVTSSNASPAEIAAASRSGAGQGLTDTLVAARRDLAGGVT